MKKRNIFVGVLLGISLLLGSLQNIIAQSEVDIRSEFTEENRIETMKEYEIWNPKYKQENEGKFSKNIWEKYGLLVMKNTERKSVLQYKDLYDLKKLL